jgi:FixJ family two-component response regulator
VQREHGAGDAVVYIVDDHDGMRMSLRFLIESAGYTVQTFASAKEFLADYRPDQPGCLVLDMRMPGMSGLELLEELSARGDMRPAIMITGYGSVPTAVRALKAGAIDFLEKPFHDEELLERIRHCLQLEAMWRRWQTETIDIVGRLQSLSPREREVLDCIIAGEQSREIAQKLNVSINTVADYRARIMRKMQARTALDLVRMVALCRKSGPLSA